tara:strand:+ start:84 stop:545 length:462 start_codon:yes stop_codon:yes gene_type:complete
MSKIGLSLKINTSQIDMNRLFAGQKGNYLDCTIFVDLAELDQYGNSGMVTQDVSKDEKANGVKGNILGNGKVFWVEGGQAPQQAGQMPQQNFQQAPPQQQAPQQFAPQAPQQAPQQQAPQQFAPQQMQQAPTLAQQAAQHRQARPQDFDDIPF